MDAVTNTKPTIMIAVVDDHVYTATFIATEIEKKGFRTFQAYNGPDAIKMCKENKPDLVLLDVMLPGMNGFDVAAQLKDTKIVFMTGQDDFYAKANNTPGRVAVIRKPVNMNELFLVLKNLFKTP